MIMNIKFDEMIRLIIEVVVLVGMFYNARNKLERLIIDEKIKLKEDINKLDKEQIKIYSKINEVLFELKSLRIHIKENIKKID
jgi:hypothetical protein